MKQQLESALEECDQKDTATPVYGIVVGQVLTLCDDGKAWVKHSLGGSDTALVARSLVSIVANDVGREIILMFEGGDPNKPIIMGLLQGRPSSTSSVLDAMLGTTKPSIDVKADDERLTLSASKEIIIQCGKASITLTRAGKVLIRGAYVLSRSSGVNKIKGGSVQIN